MPSRIQCRLILAALLLAGFVGHVAYVSFSPPLGLAGDEAHYWDWSRQLDWSYYSKGPAVAVLIRGGRLLFGDTLLGVRFPAMVLAVVTSLCTYWLAARVFKSERLALGTVALTHTVPLCVAGSLLMTIDSPFYCCWAAATCVGYLAAVEGRRWAWPVAGVIVGLGFLAKYAALLWLVNLLIYLAIADRRRLKSPWPWLASAIALLFTTPVLWWNHRHDWVSFGHVARSTSENQNGFNPLKILADLGELVGGQVGLLNPIVCGFVVGGVWMALRSASNASKTGGSERTPTPTPAGSDSASATRFSEERSDPAGVGVGARSVRPQDCSASGVSTAAVRTRLVADPRALVYLLAIGLPFFACVTLITLFKNTEPNWPAPAYFTLFPLAAWFVARTWPESRGWLIGAVAIGLVVIVVLHENAWLYRLRPVAQSASRIVGYDDIGRRVSDELKTLPPDAFVLTAKYQFAAWTAFYVDGHPKTYCLGSYLKNPKDRDRLTQYDIWSDRDLSQAALRGRDAVFVGRAPNDLYEAFDRVEALPDLPVVRNGVILRKQSLYRCYGFRGMTRPTDGLTKR